MKRRRWVDRERLIVVRAPPWKIGGIRAAHGRRDGHRLHQALREGEGEGRGEGGGR